MSAVIEVHFKLLRTGASDGLVSSRLIRFQLLLVKVM